MMRRAVVLLLLLFAPAPLTRASTPHPFPTVRPLGDLAAAVLSRALDRSATVRALAARIQVSDVIVYLDVRRDLPPGVSACLTWIATTPASRIVRVSITPGLRYADGVAFVGHELQHVVEVIEHPEVRSSADLDALYRRIGERGSQRVPHWDTVDAINVERVTRLEALRARSSTARQSG